MAKKQKSRGKGAGTLVLRGGTWFGRWVVDGKIYTRTTETSIKQKAEEKLAEFTAVHRLGSQQRTLETVAARLGGVKAEIQKYEDEKPATTIRHGWQAYLDQQNRPDSGPSTLRCYEQWFEAFARWMQETHPAAAELRHVTQTHADQYAGKLQREVAATTVNRHMNTLALVWRVLEKSARITGNPWKQIARKRFAVHTRRELTIEELTRLCAAAKGETRLLLALGIYCGLRLGDAALLRWSDADMVKGLISLVPQKTARRSQKRVTLPIHRTLFALLAETPEASRKGYVMPGIAERHQQYAGALSKDIGDLFWSVGIETKAEVAGSKRKRADCGFHSLRHTFVSLCAAGGVPQSVVQSLVGHGSPAMTSHYTHVGLAAAQSAVATLPDIGTHADTAPQPENAATVTLGDVLNALPGLSDEDLAAVADRARELSESRKAARQ
jgi:integrase